MNQLKRKRDELRTKWLQLVASTEGREWTAEETAQFNQIYQQYQKANSKLKRNAFISPILKSKS